MRNGCCSSELTPCLERPRPPETVELRGSSRGPQAVGGQTLPPPPSGHRHTPPQVGSTRGLRGQLCHHRSPAGGKSPELAQLGGKAEASLCSEGRQAWARSSAYLSHPSKPGFRSCPGAAPPPGPLQAFQPEAAGIFLFASSDSHDGGLDMAAEDVCCRPGTHTVLAGHAEQMPSPGPGACGPAGAASSPELVMWVPNTDVPPSW